MYKNKCANNWVNKDIAKDKLGLRPGVIAENDEKFAIASEEVSLRQVIDTHNVEQISPGEVRVYEI